MKASKIHFKNQTQFEEEFAGNRRKNGRPASCLKLQNRYEQISEHSLDLGSSGENIAYP